MASTGWNETYLNTCEITALTNDEIIEMKNSIACY